MDGPFPASMMDDIRRVLRGHTDKRGGCDVYDDVFDSPLMFPLQRRGELAWMMQQARKIAPRTVMEIGSDKGGGLYHWVKSLPTVRNVVACEIRGTPYADCFEMAFPTKRFVWMPHCSRNPDVRQSLRKTVGLIDCLFIDGDKVAFEEDFDHYKGLLSPRALVFMHDVQDEAPRRAFDAVSRRPGYAGTVYVNREDAEWAVERERVGIPSASEHENWLRHWKGRSCGVGMIRAEGGW